MREHLERLRESVIHEVVPSSQIDASDSVKKARLNELLTEGIITDDVHREVRGLIDQELAAVASELSERDQPSSGKPDEST